MEVVEGPQEGGQGLARAGRGHDQRVAAGGDRLPAFALGPRGLGERLGEPAADEREELRHTASLYLPMARVICRRDPVRARRRRDRGGRGARRLARSPHAGAARCQDAGARQEALPPRQTLRRRHPLRYLSPLPGARRLPAREGRHSRDPARAHGVAGRPHGRCVGRAAVLPDLASHRARRRVAGLRARGGRRSHGGFAGDRSRADGRWRRGPLRGRSRVLRPARHRRRWRQQRGRARGRIDRRVSGHGAGDRHHGGDAARRALHGRAGHDVRRVRLQGAPRLRLRVPQAPPRGRGRGLHAAVLQADAGRVTARAPHAIPGGSRRPRDRPRPLEPRELQGLPAAARRATGPHVRRSRPALRRRGGLRQRLHGRGDLSRDGHRGARGSGRGRGAGRRRPLGRRGWRTTSGAGERRSATSWPTPCASSGGSSPTRRWRIRSSAPPRWTRASAGSSRWWPWGKRACGGTGSS